MCLTINSISDEEMLSKTAAHLQLMKKFMVSKKDKNIKRRKTAIIDDEGEDLELDLLDVNWDIFCGSVDGESEEIDEIQLSGKKLAL